MLIRDMESKTSIEVQDTDLLVIEDCEDTKSITVKELRDFLMKNDGVENTVKSIVNNIIDNVSNALLSSKFVIRQTKSYDLKINIFDTSGYIYYSFRDPETNMWLTDEDINTLLTVPPQNEDGEPTIRDFAFNLLIQLDSPIYFEADQYVVTSTDHVPELANEELNIGVIKANFSSLKGAQNTISSITKTSFITILPEDKEHMYEFVIHDSLFTNDVPYVSPIPSGN